MPRLVDRRDSVLRSGASTILTNSFLLAQAGMNFVLAKLILFILILFVGSILKKIAEGREAAERLKQGKPPTPQPKKERPFRNEIEQFLEEVGRRRAPNDRPARPDVERVAGTSNPRASVRTEERKTPPQTRDASSRPRSPVLAPPVPLGPARPLVPSRPGAEIASRKPPGSENLGQDIRVQVGQLLDSNSLTQRVQLDLGNDVEQTVRQHLGQTITRGAVDKAATSAVGSVLEPIPLAAMLRNPDGIRKAILMNEILGRPKGLRRTR